MSAHSPENGSLHCSKYVKRLIVAHYDALHAIAAGQLGQEAPGNSLEATALLNEAVVRMLAPGPEAKFNDDAHFLAVARLMMKHVLTDRARQRRSTKGGGGLKRQELTDDVADQPPDLGALVIKDELQRLAREDPVASAIVALRCQGYSIEEAAGELALSRSAAYGLWSFARAWLLRHLHDDPAA